MSDSQDILTHIHGLLGDKDPGIVGDMSLDDEELSLRDGLLTLRVDIVPNQGKRTAATMVHAHVVSSLFGPLSTDKELSDDTPIELSACVVGIDRVHKMALFDVARVWVDLVAGPVLSLLMGEPVLEAERMASPDTDGASGFEGWMGPVGFRFAETATESRIGKASVFQDATRLANPQSVHLAKATLDGAAGPEWRYTLEINAHQASYSDPRWDGVGEPTHGGIAIRFAAFHHLGKPNWVESRTALDQAVLNYVQLHTDDSVADVDEQFLRQMNDPELATQISNFVISACARIILDGQVKNVSNMYHCVGPGGQLGEPRRLLSEPIFARTMGLRSILTQEDNVEGLKKCALRSSELNAFNNAAQRGSDPANLVLMPIVVPEADATEHDIQLALQQLVKQIPKKPKPWWRLW